MNLTKANLRGLNITGADLQGGVTEEQIRLGRREATTPAQQALAEHDHERADDLDETGPTALLIEDGQQATLNPAQFKAVEKMIYPCLECGNSIFHIEPEYGWQEIQNTLSAPPNGGLDA